MYDDVRFFKKQNSISMVTMKFTVRTHILHRYSVYDNDQVGGFDFDLRYDFTSHPSESLLMCTLNESTQYSHTSNFLEFEIC